MYCSRCGTNCGGLGTCPNCGNILSNNQYGSQGYYMLPQNSRPAPQGSPGKVLTFGIIGLALFSFGIFGLIFSIIGLSQSSGYQSKYGDVSTQVRIGKILSIVGLILSILMTILWIFIIVMIVKYAGDVNTYRSYRPSYRY